MDFSVNTAPPIYKITAIVSVYKAEEFLRGCLEDLVAQSIFPQTEVIIIDSNSPENEKTIVCEFMEKFPNIKYERTAERETLYAAWNRALAKAQGQYITNANADDRHASYAFEKLTMALDENEHIALAYANSRVTNEKNALFDDAPVIGRMRWLPYDHLNLLRWCEMGSQPVWRRKVHEEVGLFNPSYTVVGDYDMWLRISERYPMLHLNEELGLYLEYDNNLASQNIRRTLQEHIEVQKLALTRFMSKDFKPHIPFSEQIQTHKSRLERYLENLRNGSTIRNQNKLAYHLYAYMLLSLRENEVNIQNIYYKVSNIPKVIDADYIENLLV